MNRVTGLIRRGRKLTEPLLRQQKSFVWVLPVRVPLLHCSAALGAPKVRDASTSDTPTAAFSSGVASQ
jgi:hypothetical protein